MAPVQLVLGWSHLAEVDERAVAPLRMLCDLLDLGTHWDPSQATLYIAPPLRNKNLAVTVADSSAAPETARRVADEICRRLRQAGAHVLQWRKPLDGQSADLVVWLALEAHPSGSVSVAHNLPPWSHSRKLAALLTEEIAGALALPPARPRASVSAIKQPASAALTITLGCPQDLLQSETDHPWMEEVAAAVFRGLSRFWAPPTLESLVSRASGLVPPPPAPAADAVAEPDEAEEPEARETPDTVQGESPGPGPEKEGTPEPEETAEAQDTPKSESEAIEPPAAPTAEEPEGRLQLWSDAFPEAGVPVLVLPAGEEPPRLWLESDPSPPRPPAEPADEPDRTARVLGSRDNGGRRKGSGSGAARGPKGAPEPEATLEPKAPPEPKVAPDPAGTPPQATTLPDRLPAQPAVPGVRPTRGKVAAPDLQAHRHHPLRATASTGAYRPLLPTPPGGGPVHVFTRPKPAADAGYPAPSPGATATGPWVPNGAGPGDPSETPAPKAPEVQPDNQRLSTKPRAVPQPAHPTPPRSPRRVARVIQQGGAVIRLP